MLGKHGGAHLVCMGGSLANKLGRVGRLLMQKAQTAITFPPPAGVAPVCPGHFACLQQTSALTCQRWFRAGGLRCFKFVQAR